MTVYEAIKWGQAQLQTASKDDALIAPAIFLEDILKVNAAGLFLKYQDSLTTDDYDKYLLAIAQRKSSVPLAYIVGKKEFYGLSFLVNEHVLIPRPETELMVDTVQNLMQAQNRIKSVLDVGTGSGVLAITIKSLFPKLNVYASDISLNALAVAKQNAIRLHQTIEFFHSDLLDLVDVRVDLMVCNLPYISYCDQRNLSEEVLNEPENALFAAEQGLALYKQLIQQSHRVLNPQGFIVCEFGMGQASTMQNFFEQNNYTVLNCLKDLCNIDRIIVAQAKLV